MNEVFDSSIQVVPVCDEQLAEGMSAAGVLAPIVELLVAMDATARAGGVNIVSNTIQTLTGKPPRLLREFLIQNRAVLLQ